MAAPMDRWIVLGAFGLFGLLELIGAADRLSFVNLSWSLSLSRSLNLSRSVRVVPANNAARNRSENSVTASSVTCYPTNDSSLYAALRLGTRD